MSVRRSPKNRHAVTKNIALRMQGYKSLKDLVDVPIRPLTLIGGVNSSGKSSFMQGILLVKQTIEAQFDPGAMLLNGPNVNLTSMDQIFYRGRSKASAVASFSVGVRLNNAVVDLSFKRSRNGVALDCMKFAKGDFFRKVSEGDSIGIAEARSFPGIQFRSYEKFVEEVGSVAVANRNRCFLDLSIKTDNFDFSLVNHLVNEFRKISIGIIHVPGLRGNPERVYSRSAVGSSYPGSFEKYVAGLINAWQNSSKDVERDKLKELNSDLEALGLTWKVMARPLDDTSVELLVGRLSRAQQGGAHDVVNIADVGFGVSQTLPVLVALISARPGQIVYLEQPEIHLHPKAQSELAKVIVRHAKRGVRVIVETHSSLLIKGAQTALARKDIEMDDVALHWFSRSEFDGSTSVCTADVDGYGRFGEWPVDFDDVVMDSEMEYLDAVDVRMRSEINEAE